MPGSPDLPLYNLAPLAQLLAFGLVIGLGPLLWIWMHHRKASPVRRLQALTVLTLFLTFDLVLFGAFTRLTDSGLGCPDWPGCYGHSSPVGAGAHIEAAQQTLPSGPVTHGKAWVEMVHRYLATGVGVLIVTLTVMSFVQRRFAGRLGRHPGATGPPQMFSQAERRILPSPWWAAATLIWVCLQGTFGALTVTQKLFPAIVVMHLAGAFVLLALLCHQMARYSIALDGRDRTLVSSGLRNWLLICAAMLSLQILLGGWVSTNYAVLACTTFPTCQGSWWPPMNFQQGFELWRPLGQLADGAYLEFSALTAIHYMHRLWAYGVFAALAVLVVWMGRYHSLRRTARVIGAVAVLQALTGIANVVLDWPLLAAVLHTGGAAALAVALVWALSVSRRSASLQRASTDRAPAAARGPARGPREATVSRKAA